MVEVAKKFFGVVLLAGLVGCQAADGTNQSPDVALIDGLMKGLGAVDPNEKPIDYKPRAPLAMPAEPTALPEPETKVATTETAEWPQQRESEQLTEIRRLYAGSENQSEPLSPQQMRGFKITGVTGQQPRDVVGENRQTELLEGDLQTRAEQKAEWERLQQLKAQQAGIDQSGLASRRYLVDPPTTYSTPSPDAPMPTVAKAKRKANNADTYDSTPLDPRCLAGEDRYCR